MLIRYDQYRGIICSVQIEDGVLNRGDLISFYQNKQSFEVQEIGLLLPFAKPIQQLHAGHVCHVPPSSERLDWLFDSGHTWPVSLAYWRYLHSQAIIELPCSSPDLPSASIDGLRLSLPCRPVLLWGNEEGCREVVIEWLLCDHHPWDEWGARNGIPLWLFGCTAYEHLPRAFIEGVWYGMHHDCSIRPSQGAIKEWKNSMNMEMVVTN